MTVYCVTELGTKIDVSSAYVYGDMYYVNSRYVFSDELKNDRPPRGFILNIDKAADAFDPRKDYLLLAGDHLQMMMMASALAIRYVEFYVLRYEREAKGYVPILIGQSNIGTSDAQDRAQVSR